MLDILAVIPGKKRHTQSGWYTFNAVCCHHRGHKPDRRSRGGIKFVDELVWSYSCFNCGFKCGVNTGQSFSYRVKQLLSWCGADAMQIERWSFQYFGMGTPLERARASLNNTQTQKPIEFEHRPLPEGATRLNEQDPTHRDAVDYIHSRGLKVSDYSFYVTPDAPDRLGKRIIIPYYYNKQIVGNTSRFYDDLKPKYLSDQQRGYVFNIDAQQQDWNVCILVEGQFDAISIGGCAYMGANITDEQAKLLRNLRRRIIVVPDRDSTGMTVADRALQLGYQVSIPDWHDDIKDVNDAVKRYGKLPTLLSILNAATSSKITVEVKRKQLK